MNPEPEVCSIKVLLKQVYGVHTTKIKSLEDEIEELKRNLLEATTKLKNYESECKRCIELEEAFNSCKAALLEQSKMFENLGQKLSSLNSSENKTTEGEQLKQVLQAADDLTDESNMHVVPVKKMDLSTNSKIHFLKNLMSSSVDENQESLELSVPLQRNMYQEYSTLNPDSLVLVPNTMEFGWDDKENQKKLEDKTDDCIIVAGYQKEILETNLNDLCKNTETKERRKRRSSDDDSNLNNDKINKKNKVKVSPLNKKIKSFIEDTDNNFTLVTKLAKIPTSPKRKNSKSCDDFNNNYSKNVNTPTLDIKICKMAEDDFVNDFKNFADKNSSVGTASKDESLQVTVSPLLLPLKEKTNSKVINNPPTIAEDINDFQIPFSNKKANNDGDSWTSCDKKKLSRKSANLAPIKSASRFKMQLDSLPPNFKKPTYRQTKLSKSIFLQKSTTALKQEFDVECIEVEEKFEDFAKDLATVSPDVRSVSCSTKTVDFDATCIPDNYEYEIISSNSVGSNKSKTGKAIPNSIMIVKDDFDSLDSDSFSEMIVESKPSTSKQEKGKDSLNSKLIDVGQLGNSFDRLPKKSEPDYKYKEDTVRKKSDRKQLTAFDCKECEKYYSDLGLSEDEKKQRMQKCSRHRSKFAPPPTPEHFWELEFPDTQECKARGYLNETQKVKLKTHRKRPLQSIYNFQ